MVKTMVINVYHKVLVNLITRIINIINEASYYEVEEMVSIVSKTSANYHSPIDMVVFD